MQGTLRRLLLWLTLVVAGVCSPLSAQQSDPPPSPAPANSHANTVPIDGPVPHPNETNFLRNLAQDQKDIWTSPFHLTAPDAKWLVPFGGITAGLLVTDPQSSAGMFGPHTGTYKTISDAGLFAAGGMTGVAYVWGRITHRERLRETGVLATEAMINALGVDYALSYSTGRLRPYQSNYQNVFFSGGTSFPSDHAALTWAFASVVASEYPNPAAVIGAYGLAAGVSIARAMAEQHFLSDVFVGGLIGYEIGRNVYKKRHDKNLDALQSDVAYAPNPDNIASTYVPMGSWIYSALDILISRGYIDTAYQGLRPWTRNACALMLSEFNEDVGEHPDLPRDILRVKNALDAEFADELGTFEGRPMESIRLDSVYTGITGIAGQPLNDNNLGQTIINNQGRPYQEGVNDYTGFTARAEDGRYAFYVNGEYQHSPSAPPYPLLARQTIADVNNDPLQPAIPFPTINRFRLLDTYVTFKFLGQDFSVGKQTLWWGPTESGSLLMSNNAEPFWMLRINRTEPYMVPGLSKLLGPFRFDNYFGQLSGHDQFPQGPFMYGQKASFKPYKNLELGFSRAAVFAGQNHVPLTFGSFWNSFISTGDVPITTKFSRNDPGARFSNFDFTWRLPFLENWLTLYTDSFSHDDVNPVSAPRRAAVNPGLYLSHFPRIPKLDLRVEAANTDPDRSPSRNGTFLYYEILYRNLYLNNSNLMGNWIGREGKGYQAWSTYHLSPMSSIQFAYRMAKIAQDYIPGGTTQQIGNVSANLRLRKDVQFSGYLQYESWLVPVLSPTRNTDFTTSVQLTWWPSAWIRKQPIGFKDP